MNGGEGAAHLEWWANAVTCLFRMPVRVEETVAQRVWNVSGLVLAEGDEQEGFELLMQDPFFTLRLPDGSVWDVELRGDPAGGIFRAVVIA